MHIYCRTAPNDNSVKITILNRCICFLLLYKQTAATECRGNESFVIYVLVTSACGQVPSRFESLCHSPCCCARTEAGKPRLNKAHGYKLSQLFARVWHSFHPNILFSNWKRNNYCKNICLAGKRGTVTCYSM